MADSPPPTGGTAAAGKGSTYSGFTEAGENFALAVIGNDIFPRLVRLAMRALHSRAALVVSISVSPQVPRCAASTGKVNLAPGDLLPVWLVRACQTTFAGLAANRVDDFPPSSGINAPEAALGWVRACLCVPLQTADFAGALVVLDGRSRTFSREEVAALQDLAWLSTDTLLREASRRGDNSNHDTVTAFQKSLLESLTEASVDGILVVSNQGQVLLYNDRFVRLWQLPQELVSARVDDELLQAVHNNIVDPDEFRARVAYLYENPDEESRENIVLKDGRIFDRYSAPVRSESGRRYGRVWFFRDISAQVIALRRVEELAIELSSQQKWLEGLLDLLPVPVLLIDPDSMQVIFANKGADRFAGGMFPKLPLGSTPRTAPMPEGLREPVERAVAGQGARSFVAEYTSVEGVKTLLLHSELFSERYGHPAVVVLAFDDVTELKRVQSELQQSIRVRDEFLSIASHELKTPVTALHLQIQSVMRAGQKTPHKVDLDWLLGKVTRAETQVQRLTRLIDNLLDVSRITAGRLEFEPEDLDLEQVAAETAERLREEATRVGCELRVRRQSVVRGYWDRLRLEQVVTNLLTNAVKYGSGKPVELWVDVLSGDRARLNVKDSGIGVPQENQGRIFERFERAVSERQYSGLGLGLWITRQIVEALQGTIAVVSGPNEGSLFTVELPRQQHFLDGSSEPPPLGPVRRG